MVYTLNQEVPSYLCDRVDRLHPWAAIRLCQEVTEYHGNSVGGGFATLIAQNRAWVIVRSYYRFQRRPAAFERVMLNTWSRGNDGLFAYRDYRICSMSGEVVMTGTSYWTLIDFAQRRAVRLREFVDVYESVPDVATDRDRLDRIVLPPMDAPDFRLTLVARHSMIDHTDHVNNSEYIKWIFDALNECGFDADQPFGIELNFQHETKVGDTVNVDVRRVDDVWYAHVTNSVGTSVTAKIKETGD